MGHAHLGSLYGVRGAPHNQASNFQQQQQPASYEVWNNFFMSAGIPSGVAHDYAVTFSQHRIRIDMLKEITKDILIDMGIKAMGDIIAILRHAKHICTQNELKANTGAAKTITSNSNLNRSMPVNSSQIQQTHTASINVPPKQHLSQRTPITLDRGSASVSSMIGNKIPSKLNLDSGALIASSSISTTTIRDSNSASNKRPSSTLSYDMSKRLRPADSGRVSEKTLTVHYPPRAAIERAARRISSGAGGQSQKNGSIKSRLGSTASHSGRGSESFNQTAAVTNNNKHKQRNNRGNSTTPSKYAPSSSSRRHDSRQSRERGTSSNDTKRRPKSTVFNRLGESAR